jgi:hypothetical protein
MRDLLHTVIRPLRQLTLNGDFFGMQPKFFANLHRYRQKNATPLIFCRISTSPSHTLKKHSICNVVRLACLISANFADHCTHLHIYITYRGTMPTLINELNPMQLEWLYENQMTDGELKEGATKSSSYLQSASSVFRNVKLNNSKKQSCRKRKRNDSITSSSSTDGIVFPFEGEALSWSEQFENLMAYKEQYGVSQVYIM